MQKFLHTSLAVIVLITWNCRVIHMIAFQPLEIYQTLHVKGYLKYM